MIKASVDASIALGRFCISIILVGVHERGVSCPAEPHCIFSNLFYSCSRLATKISDMSSGRMQGSPIEQACDE